MPFRATIIGLAALAGLATGAVIALALGTENDPTEMAASQPTSTPSTDSPPAAEPTVESQPQSTTGEASRPFFEFF